MNYMMGLFIISLYIYVKYVIVSLKYFKTVKEQLRNTVFLVILYWTSNVLSSNFFQVNILLQEVTFIPKNNKTSTK